MDESIIGRTESKTPSTKAGGGVWGGGYKGVRLIHWKKEKFSLNTYNNNNVYIFNALNQRI
jgi:hypothetical protein